MATLRLAEQLEKDRSVIRINTMIHANESRKDKWRHYAKAGETLGQTLEQYPNATVVWTSISPEAAGHFRDVRTIFPRLKGKRVIAAAHWGKFAQIFSHRLTRWSARRLLPGLDQIVFTAPVDRKSTRLNSSHSQQSRMPSSA